MPRPTVVSVTMFRNEADVLESFVRYHTQIVDRMVIADHFSVDTGRAVLDALVAEGLPIHATTETDPEYQGARSLTRFGRAELQRGADFVLPIDPDEFLTTRDGSPVRPHLDTLPTDRVTKIPWRTHVPTADMDDAEPDLFRRIPHRRSEEGQQFYKVIVPRALLADPANGIGTGSHTFVRAADLVPGELPFLVHPTLQLAHFPVRSRAQIEQKVYVGWPAVLAKANRQRDESAHLQRMWAQLAAGEALSSASLHDLALGYSNNRPTPGLTYDPIVTFTTPATPRLPESRVGSPVRALMQFAEQQAETVASLRAALLATEDRRGWLRAVLGRSAAAKVVRSVARLRARGLHLRPFSA